MNSSALEGSANTGNSQRELGMYVRRVKTVLKRMRPSADPSSSVTEVVGSVCVEATVHEGEEVEVSVVVEPRGDPIAVSSNVVSAVSALPAPLVRDSTVEAPLFREEKVEEEDLTTGGPVPTQADTSAVSAAIKQSIEDIKLSSNKGTIREPGSSAVSRGMMQQEKARALFEKYGFTLEPGEWTFPNRDTSERVEKPVRMRIHRQCHRCQTTFGPDKTCSNCRHLRCKKCPRYPAKTSKDPKDQIKAGSALINGGSAAVIGKEVEGAKPKSKAEVQMLTKPSKNGGQDLVRKTVVQRIHRKCHKCQKDFARDEKTCAMCNHVRCKKCPRDPAKLKKHPDGYHGDVEPDIEPVGKEERIYRKIKQRLRWSCHSCESLFVEKSKTCAMCSHKRCQDCKRDPPKKIKPTPDPEILRSLEAKLASMNFSSSTLVSAIA
ncbi:MAG: hypothetical protein M1827_002302 [Pycnora praestabilis]|nr:MAG: hypothetical protein M1827_002302 [Pycnora praestabilis]